MWRKDVAERRSWVIMKRKEKGGLKGAGVMLLRNRSERKKKKNQYFFIWPCDTDAVFAASFGIKFSQLLNLKI
jgi:hypothetical protein